VPPLRFGRDLQALLSQADVALGRLDGSIQTLPNPDLFVLMYVRKEAVLSSQIEGTQSSLQDVLAAEAQVLAPDRPKDVAEVINYVSAMNYGLERLRTLPISVRLFREIHERLVRNVRGARSSPGHIRSTQNWIGPPGCSLSEAAFVPPPPHEVAQALGDLEKFLHASAPPPLLVSIGLAHAQFETIHPFLDGNGRIGRLLITLLLCERGVLARPVLYLSHFFRRHRQEYYDRLQAIRDAGDWEAWLEFFLRGVAEVSQQSAGTARRVLGLREEHRSAITRSLGRGAAGGHRVLEYLFDHPIVSVGELREVLNISYQGANQLVARLQQLGILQECTGRSRNRRFRYASYIELFTEGD